MKTRLIISAFILLLASSSVTFPDESGYLKNLRNARTHAENNDWDKAIESYNRALGEDPEGIDAMKELASIYLSQRSDTKAACPYIEKLKSLIPGDPQVQSLVSICKAQSSHYETTGSPGLAAPAVNTPQAVPRIPTAADDKWEFSSTAYRLYGDKNFEGAMQAADKALQVSPGDVSLLILKAKICFALQRLGEAAHFNAEAGNLQQAIRFLSYSVQSNPSDVSTYFWLGHYFYERAIQIKPDYAEAYLNLGMAYIGLKDWQKAKTVLKKSLQLKPSLCNAYYNLYIVEQGMGNTQNAMWYLQKFSDERNRASRP